MKKKKTNSYARDPGEHPKQINLRRVLAYGIRCITDTFINNVDACLSSLEACLVRKPPYEFQRTEVSQEGFRLFSS